MKGYIRLANGDCFEGEWEKAPKQPVEGEVVFFTGMTGYQEVVTDPSFKGQIVVFTYPLIGNYGINEADFESLIPQISAAIVSECNPTGHHYESVATFYEYLQKWNIPVLTHVDTRAIVKRIRRHGVMGGVLVQDPQEGNFDNFLSIEEKMLVKDVSVKKVEVIGEGEYHVVLVDYGYKKSIVRSLNAVGCKVTIVPFDTTLEQITALEPDGIMLSNGPGDPKKLTDQSDKIRKLATNYPILAICLGHQLLSIAFGAETKKLTFGHRGANQPVIDLRQKKVFMTSQNHSFVVEDDSLKQTEFTVRYRNVNDGSVEGMEHSHLPIMSVQFHPEAHPGPADSGTLFNDFVCAMKSVRREKVYA